MRLGHKQLHACQAATGRVRCLWTVGATAAMASHPAEPDVLQQRPLTTKKPQTAAVRPHQRCGLTALLQALDAKGLRGGAAPEAPRRCTGRHKLACDEGTGRRGNHSGSN